VEAHALGRRYGERVALDGLSLRIEPGESFGLLGANGAGKTTFIRLLMGFLVPTRGTLQVDGVSPATRPLAVQSRIGYVPETPRLYEELRTDDFLRFAAGIRGLQGAARRDAVSSALGRFRLETVARRLIGHLSKGYRQRVSLAQAFLHAPALVVVDEPTSDLDPLQREEIRELLAGLAGQCTLVALGESESLLGASNPLALFRGGDDSRRSAEGTAP